MNSIIEHFLLEELDCLCAIALAHSSHLEKSMGGWLAAEEELKKHRTEGALRHLILMVAGDLALADQHAAQQTARVAIVTHIESYLQVHARIAEILRPKALYSDHAARSQAIAALLKQDPKHWREDTEFRNAWIQFDGFLDDNSMASQSKLSPHRVCSTEALHASTTRLYYRTITVDDRSVHLPGKRVELPGMFERVRSLQSHVRIRLDDWGARHSSTSGMSGAH